MFTENKIMNFVVVCTSLDFSQKSDITPLEHFKINIYCPNNIYYIHILSYFIILYHIILKEISSTIYTNPCLYQCKIVRVHAQLSLIKRNVIEPLEHWYEFRLTHMTMHLLIHKWRERDLNIIENTFNKIGRKVSY